MSPSTTDEGHWLPPLIGLTGILLGLVLVGELSYVRIFSDTVPQAFYIGVVTSIPFIVGTIYAGYRLRDLDLAPHRFERLGMWWGGCAIVTIVGILVINLSFRPLTPKMVVGTVRWSAAIGGGVGLALGVFEARAIRREVAAEKAQLRQQELRRKLEAAQLGQAIYETEPTRLSQAADSAWEAVDGGASTLTARTDAVFEADRDRLEEILRLIFKYSLSQAEEPLRFRSELLDEDSGFSISHDGPAVPHEERELLGEFVSGLDAGGSAAFLVMADQLASAHGWALTIERQGDRTYFHFSGPTVVEARS